MSMYWATSSALALTQNAVLMSPRIREMFHIPITPSHKEEPFKYVCQNFKEKWSFRKKVTGTYLNIQRFIYFE